MWQTLTVLAAGAALAVHFWWRGRARELEAALARERAALHTAQQEHQRAASQALARQQTLFDSMSDGVLVLDPAGRVQLVNPALERLFALTDDVRGRTLMEALRWHELTKLFERLLIENIIEHHELAPPGLAGRCLQVSAATVFDRAGASQGSIFVFRDLTRLKELERTRQEFVANVSHELRTPLSLIKGFVETLLDGAKDDPAVATRFLHTIERHADRLTFLIEDLLTISKLESGQIVLNLQPTSLAEVTERVLDDLSERAVQKQVRLENQIAPELLARADAERLQQVLFNLVDNAIKYGRPEGRVRVQARVSSPELIEVSVADDGPGIPPEARERVFERFFRADKARSRETGGTGLGLAIVKHIVQAHAGEVGVHSEPGQGTTFFFTLPAVVTA